MPEFAILTRATINPSTHHPMTTTTTTKQNITTSAAGHTPGNWHIGIVCTDRAIYGNRGEHIATLPDMLANDEVLANARLIAAAPELLEALQSLLDCPDLNLGNLEIESEAAIDKARLAIARATTP